jgi:acetyltransferase-like isoleucine patch superfamily enzyme
MAYGMQSPSRMNGNVFSVASALRRAAALCRFRPIMAALRIELEDGVNVEGAVWAPGSGRINIARGVRFRARRAPIELYAHRGAEIWIEEGAVIEAGASIEATRCVRIGEGAHIGAFAKIIDNNFHSTTGDRNERPDAVPVAVGRAVLLPGADIGEGARVGANRVVSFPLPAGSVG